MTSSLKKSAFILLAKPVRKIVEEKGFLKPTDPQARAIPPILKGKNVLLIAPTGTGKTEAAFLPVFSKFIELIEKPRGIKILYITPLRSLNRDLLQRLEWWCAKLDIKVAVRHGDTDVKERAFQSRDPPDMLITTPETLQAIFPGKNMRRHLAAIRWVIIDEVHEFAEDKRGSQLSLALERLRMVTEKDFQVIGLSATIGSPRKVASFLAGADRPVEIVKVSVARLMKFQIVYPTPSQEDEALATKLFTNPEVAARLRVMRSIIENHQSALLFTNTRSVAEILASRFKVWDVDFPVSIHHGSLAKPARIAAETGLKKGELKGLVCTSSLELGIDIGKIDVCIQYMSPRQVSRLVQRVGRSGHRIGRVAKGIIITMDSDDTLEAMVVARRAYLEDLESVSIPEKPLDVLTHEIVGLFLHARRWEFSKILEAFVKSYPYRELSENDLVSVLTYMHTRYPRLAWVSLEDKVAMYPSDRKAMYQFYYENLSMIPDERTYLIIDETNDAPVGVLDEAFVAEYGDPGTRFIIRGSPWKIVSVYGDKLYVKPIDDPTGAIPSWVGEEIPVPFAVAREVGEIRGAVEAELAKGTEPEKIASMLAEKYPADKETILKAIREIIEQFSKGLPVPTDKRIVIERGAEYVVVHACVGSLTNRTLATLLGHLLSEKTGCTTAIQADPYRAMLQCAEPVSTAMVKDLLLELSKTDAHALAIDAFKTTGIFKRRMIQVARKFGAVSKWADFSNISLNQLVKSFQGTAIFDEAVKATLDNDADIQDLAALLEDIRSGEVEVVITEVAEPTPIAFISLEKIGRWTSLISSERLQRLAIESARVRLLNEVKTVVCADCWNFLEALPVKELGDGFTCPRCGSRRIGVLDVSVSEVQHLLGKKNKGLTAKDRETLEYAGRTADLVAAHGTRSALILAGKGLRLSDAEEILSKTDKMDDVFFELIIDVEKKALARRFW